MMKSQINKTSLLLAILLVFGGIASAMTVNTDGFSLPKVVIYFGALVGSAGLFYAHLRIVRQSKDGKSYVGVVVLTYVFMAFTVLFACLDLIVIARAFDVVPSVGESIEMRILYGLIGAASLSTLAAAVVFVLGERNGLLFYRVDAWPLTFLKRMAEATDGLGASSENTVESRDELLWAMLATIPGGAGGAIIISQVLDRDLIWKAYGLWFLLALTLIVVSRMISSKRTKDREE